MIGAMIRARQGPPRIKLLMWCGKATVPCARERLPEPTLLEQRMGEVVVRKTEVVDWHCVKLGLFGREQALEIFHAVFGLDGRERIEYVGLPSVY